MGGIPPPTFSPMPIIYAYIDLNLQSLSQSAGSAHGNSSAPLAPVTPPGASALTPIGSASSQRSGGRGTHIVVAAAVAAPGASPSLAVPPKTSSHAVKAQLAAIFKRIGDKAQTQAGIEELAAFKDRFPEARCYS